MYELVLDFVLVLVAIAAIWHAARLGLLALVYLIKLSAVTIAVAPGAYAAAKAEAALPARDLTFDFDGNTGDAKRFNTIVKDRMTRTRIAVQHADLARAVTLFGREWLTRRDSGSA